MKRPKDTKDGASPKPIFFDPTSHRLVFFAIFSIVFLVFALVWFGLFFAHLYGAQLPPNSAVAKPEIAQSAPMNGLVHPHDRQNLPTPGAPVPDTSEIFLNDAALRSNQTPKVHAFVPYWSMAGLVETRTNIATIDVLLPEWFTLERSSGEISSLPAIHRSKLQDVWFEHRDHVKIFPVVKADLAQGNQSAQWLTSSKLQRDLVQAASALIDEQEFDGLCFDFVGATAQEADAIAAFSLALKAEFDRAGQENCIIAAIDDALLKHPKAADLADRLIVLAFQEPGPFSGPAPLAPQDWYEENLSALVSSIPAENLVIALGAFGMDWVSGKPAPDNVNFFDITDAAARNNGTIEMDHESLNSTVSFTDAQGKRHQIWFLDAVTAHNQLTPLPLDQVAGVAVWPVFGGDPGVWDLLSQERATGHADPNILQEIRPASHVNYTGKGPLLTVQNPAAPGRRVVVADPDSGQITDADYLQLPRAFTVALSGKLPDNSVILTFDDGPSQKYTPKILDILKTYDVPAVFFVVGTRVQDSPEIVRRIVDEGHEIGVHTYSHPNIANISDLRLRLELHASQELIKSISGQYTNLFRAPYGFDENPETPSEARVLNLLSNEHYVVVGIEIDSTDWTRPGADKIVQTVTTLAQSNQGNVILLHDAGGDREQTLLALPRIIEALQETGISFVPLSSITGQAEGLQPDSAVQDQAMISDVSFWAIRALKSATTTVFFFLITAGIIRSLVVLVLALIKERRAHTSGEASLAVTVLIPAFCEETVISEAVRSVLNSTYPIEQVIVIDDGSTDETAKVVSANFGSDPRVRLVRQENMGKAEALNHGIRLIKSPVFVAIDADTIISPEAIGLLVRHFNDTAVGAVAGNVKVGNRRNLLTRLQAVEYITSQNLDRRAFEVLNGIMVVPGSIGAWRTEAVRNSGGYTTQTIVEDADLTVSMIRNGFKVVFEPLAHAFTEAPETIAQWMRQRLRWHFGMLQIAWKHKSAFFERRAVGRISIPDLVLFGVLFSLFAPIADFVIVVNLIDLAGQIADSPKLTLENTSVLVAIAYIVYLLSDLVLATIAFSLEPNEDKRLLPWALTQRFFYRQIYWIVALRSIARAVTGRFTGWRKITRTSTMNPANTLAVSRAHGRTVSTDNKALPDHE